MQCGRIGIALIGVFAISACQSQGALVTQKEDDLAAAGFIPPATQQAYNQYKLNQLQQHLADEQLMTAQTYSDATWNWGHGVSGGPPGFGLVYGSVGW